MLFQLDDPKKGLEDARGRLEGRVKGLGKEEEVVVFGPRNPEMKENSERAACCLWVCSPCKQSMCTQY